MARAAFGLKPDHFEQIAKGVEAGAAYHRGKIRRQRCHVTDYRRATTEFISFVGHLDSVPGKVPAKPGCGFPSA
jgi:hypothetical protein